MLFRAERVFFLYRCSGGFYRKYTGRSPQDRYIVDDVEVHDDINWCKVNILVSEKVFERLYENLRAYL